MKKTYAKPVIILLSSISLLAVAAVIVAARLSSLSASESSVAFVIVQPVPYQTFQRDWDSNLGDIPITLESDALTDTLAVEISWLDDGPAERETVNLHRTEAPCTLSFYSAVASAKQCHRYAGVLAGQRPGQGTVTMRIAHTFSQDKYVPFVGIGDVFLLAGQSNSVGIADNYQVYESDTLRAAMFTRDGRWSELDDRLLTDQQLTGTGRYGSPWPLLATKLVNYTHVPVAFLPTGSGGQPISSWLDNGFMTQHISWQIERSGVQPVLALWHQGESDAISQRPAQDYANDLDALSREFHARFGMPLMAAGLGPIDRTPEATRQVRAYQDAIAELWQTGEYVLEGPTLDDVQLGDSIHFRTDEEVSLLAERWYQALIAAGLPPANAAERQIASTDLSSLRAQIAPNYTLGTPIIVIAPFDWQARAVGSILDFASADDVYPDMDVLASESPPEKFWVIRMAAELQLDTLAQPYETVVNAAWGEPVYRNRGVTWYARPTDPENTVVTFGDVFTLVQWSLPQGTSLAACGQLRVESWWRADTVPQTNYAATFVLTDSSGVPVAQSDNSPAEILTKLWQPDIPYFDHRELSIPCDLPAGEYWLLVGMYDYDTVTPLTAAFGDGTGVSSPVFLTALQRAD